MIYHIIMYHIMPYHITSVAILAHGDPMAAFAWPAFSWPHVAPVLLLLCSNLFMTLAWYGHLRFKAAPLALVVLASWGIAFIDICVHMYIYIYVYIYIYIYCLVVPASRIGHGVYSAAELKTMQD